MRLYNLSGHKKVKNHCRVTVSNQYAESPTTSEQSLGINPSPAIENDASSTIFLSSSSKHFHISLALAFSHIYYDRLLEITFHRYQIFFFFSLRRLRLTSRSLLGSFAIS